MWICAAVTIALCYALEFARRRTPDDADLGLARLAARRAAGRRAGADPRALEVAARRAILAEALGTLPLHVRGIAGLCRLHLRLLWWHRARHASDRLWRVLHQIHHSPRRLETVTAFYKHPLETVCHAVLGGVLMFPVLGLNLRAAAVCTLLAALADVFYHANMRTPRWVGWFVQRPGMHRLHHELEAHRGNHGDLPLRDALFGTLRLPGETPMACGFTGAREERLLDMLGGIDVHRGNGHGS